MAKIRDIRIKRYWSAFLELNSMPDYAEPYDVFYFGNTEELANQLAELVVQGTKRATAALPQEFEELQLRLPKPGDLSIVTDWSGNPCCIINTESVVLRPFSAVDAQFAELEGEGDKTLSWWRAAHWDYFSSQCAEKAWPLSPSMPVVLETFQVVHR